MALTPSSDPVIQKLIAARILEENQRRAASVVNPLDGSGLGSVDLEIFNTPSISQSDFDEAVLRGNQKESDTGIGFFSPEMTPAQTVLALTGPKTREFGLENLFSTGLGTFSTANGEVRPDTPSNLDIAQNVFPDMGIGFEDVPDNVSSDIAQLQQDFSENNLV